MNIKITLFAFAAMLLISGCSLLGDQADKRLGEACTDEVRYVRAQLFTDMLEKHFGREFPDAVVRLQHKSKLIMLAVASKDEKAMDAAGDSYKADFVRLAGEVLLKRGIEVSVFGFDEAVEHLKKLPVLVADINEIEATVRITCAGAANSLAQSA